MTAQLLRSRELTPHFPSACVMTIGHFDGVHLGHQQLIAKVIARAKEKKVPSLVLTFEPHAVEFFQQARVTVPRLSRLREKITALSETGIDYIFVLRFNQKIANLSANDFIKQILYETCRPHHIVIGDDFHFGHQRQGNFALLQKQGEALGFTVEAMPTVYEDHERVSSSRIRQALAMGDLDLAKKLLGHPYAMMGRIRYGDQLGRQWGFPTINIDLHRALSPLQGIYAVYVYGLSAKPLKGAASIGTRPTVDGTKTLLEVHLLNFDKVVYGRYVKVAFCKKLRDEIRYPSTDLLKEQIARDVLMTRNYFEKNE